MTSILCVEPSASYCALLSKMAAELGAEASVCQDTAAAFRHLDGARPYAVMIVSDQLNDNETGVGLIRSARLLASRATMPILFLMNERCHDLAFSAMQAGATEVVLRSDSELLNSLLREFANPLQQPVQTGRILLVEDSESQALYIAQLCAALGLGVDRCASMEGGVEYLRKGEYQAAIVDIVLQGMNSGLALVRHIRQLSLPHSRMPVLVMSGFNDVARRIEALRIGADDFLNKPFAEEEFVWRLSRVMQGRPGSRQESIGHASGHSSGNAPVDVLAWQQRGLSLRESEICKALIQGVNDKQIAADLHISFWTVRTHISSIFTKLGVINRRELMARYLTNPPA
jgi:two-component system cell cycle response regulator